MGVLDWIVLGLVAAAAAGAAAWMPPRRAAGKGCRGDCTPSTVCRH